MFWFVICNLRSLKPMLGADEQLECYRNYPVHGIPRKPKNIMKNKKTWLKNWKTRKTLLKEYCRTIFLVLVGHRVNRVARNLTRLYCIESCVLQRQEFAYKNPISRRFKIYSILSHLKRVHGAPKIIKAHFSAYRG